MASESEPVVVGGTYKWPLTATKDGSALNLTGASIDLSFVSPDEDEVKRYTFTAAAATTSYQNPADTFDVEGEWSFSFRITISGLVFETKARKFPVFASLEALTASP